MWKIRTYVRVEPDPEADTLYETEAEAHAEALNLMFMQPGEIIALVVKHDEEWGASDDQKNTTTPR